MGPGKFTVAVKCELIAGDKTIWRPLPWWGVKQLARQINWRVTTLFYFSFIQLDFTCVSHWTTSS